MKTGTWEQEEIQMLYKYAEQNLKPMQIANKLQRRKNDILRKSFRLGIRFKSPDKSLGFKSEELLKIVEKGILSGEKLIDIAKALNVRTGSLQCFMNRMGTSVGRIKKEQQIQADLGITPEPVNKKTYTCGIPVEKMKRCFTPCYATENCPAAKAAGKTNGSLPNSQIRGERSRDKWKYIETTIKIRSL